MRRPKNVELIRENGAALPLFVMTGIIVYALSWHLSVLFYEKREF